MVAYYLSCNIVNTFGISSNSVCSTVTINLTVRILQHLSGRVGNVRASQRTSSTRDAPPNMMLLFMLQEMCLCLIFPETPPHLLCFLRVFISGPVSVLTLAVRTLFRSWNPSFKILSLVPAWCHVLNHF